MLRQVKETRAGLAPFMCLASLASIPDTTTTVEDEPALLSVSNKAAIFEAAFKDSKPVFMSNSAYVTPQSHVKHSVSTFSIETRPKLKTFTVAVDEDDDFDFLPPPPEELLATPPLSPELPPPPSELLEPSKPEIAPKPVERTEATMTLGDVDRLVNSTVRSFKPKPKPPTRTTTLVASKNFSQWADGTGLVCQARATQAEDGLAQALAEFQDLHDELKESRGEVTAEYKDMSELIAQLASLDVQE